MEFLINIDLLKNELQNARIHNLPAPPSNPAAGQVYYNTSTNRIYIYNNTEWIDLTIGVDEHSIGGVYHTPDTLANLNSKITDATLDDKDSKRTPKTHGNEAHSEDYATTGYVNTTVGDTLASAQASISQHTNAATPHSGHEKTSNKGIANGYAGLDDYGQIPSSQLPAIAKHRVFIVADEAERDALDEQLHGDKAFVLSDGKTWIWNGDNLEWRLQAKSDFSTLNIAWENLTDKPSSTVANIDDAVTKRHTHSNKTTLDGITAVGSGKIITATERTKLTNAPVKYSANVGNGSSTSIVVTHDLNTRDATVILRRNVSPYDVVYADVEFTTVNTVTLRFAKAPTNSQYRATIIG